MTKKRFVTEEGCCGYYTEIIDIEKELNSSLPNPKKNLTIEELVDLLNELNDKCDFLEIENEALEEGGTKYAELYHKSLKENEQLKSEIEKLSYANEDLLEEKRIWKQMSNEYTKLSDKNEKLKQRNNNQYNQLNELWQLIEAKDWETLTAMDNEIKEDEERLQNEWKCYE